MLYVVGTPIGNLGDLSARATKTLAEVDRVLAEDTRRTRGLLAHLGIKKPVSRLDAHATAAQIDAVVSELVAGRTAALCTDAGMPGISDPGARLVQQARAQGVKVLAIPGPSAVTALVSISGLGEGGFLFLGFLPRQGQKRKAMIERVMASPEAVVLFESAERLERTLQDLAEIDPERRVVIGRELSKLHEETVEGTLQGLSTPERTWRGEVSLVIAGAEGSVSGASAAAKVLEFDPQKVETEVLERLKGTESARDIARDIALRSGRPRREIYELVERVKRRGKLG